MTFDESFAIITASISEMERDMKAGSKETKGLKGRHIEPTEAQKRYLLLGLKQPGGKLPLFDDGGQKVPARTIRACMEAGWCEPWFKNPIAPDWLVCKLTKDGRSAVNTQHG